MKTQNIGPEHPLFDHSISLFTQVLVLDDKGEILKHFKGVMAKIDAKNWIEENQ